METFEEIEYSVENALGETEYNTNEFLDCTFTGLNLSDFQFNQARFIGCQFDACSLSNAKLVGSSFRSVQFKQCKLVGVNFSTISSQMSLDFESCLMDYSVFQALKLESCSFINCSLKSADFSGSFLKNTSFSQSDLEGTVFNGCDLQKADLRQAVNYHIDVEHTLIKGAKFSIPQVLALLNSFEIEIE